MLVIGATLVAAPTTAEAAEECGATATLYTGQAACVRDNDAVQQAVGSAADDGYTYSFETRCKQGEAACGRDQRVCREGNRPGTWYALVRTDDATGETTGMGIVCLTPTDARELPVITPALVRREMERLTWPTARLEVQPPDGQTLINFDTNFFTGNTRPTSQTVTLLGQRVTIEATPTEYTWHFGDGTSRTTTGPGAAYPALDVTHAYADPGRVNPSVDTTYGGRYRVNGDAWQTIPGVLTVPGPSIEVRVRSASPHLVGTRG